MTRDASNRERAVALRFAQPALGALAVVAGGCVVVLVFEPAHPWLILAASAVAGFGLAWVLAARFARKMVHLASAARSVASGNLSSSVPLDGDETLDLARSLDDLRTQLRGWRAESLAEQRKHAAILDGLSDGVIMLADDRIVFANNAACALLSGPRDQWHGTRVDETDLPKPLASAILRGLSRHQQSTTECELDPSGRTARVTTVPLRPEDHAREVLVVVSDVTERIRLERVRRDFVANASHELKTPVAAIRLLASSSSHAAEDGDLDQTVAFARMIEEESTRLSRLVSDLLDLSRLESTHVVDALTDVRAAVGNAMLGHRIAAAARSLDLVLDDRTLNAEHLFAAADPTDVAIALDNLIDNAIAYTESGSVRVCVEADASEVRISVIDTGIGIAPEEIPRVFERFYRIDKARSRGSGGTGLGLALVKHVAERSSGSVEVTSKPGAGSTFTISLPRA